MDSNHGNLKINDKDTQDIDWIDRIPWQYQDDKSLYSGEVSNILPPHRSIDYAIDIHTGKDFLWGSMYTYSEKQLSILKEYIKEVLDPGRFGPTNSPAGALIMFIQKPHGRGLQSCVYYRGLTTVTIMNRRLQAVVNTLGDTIQSARIFIKIDLKTGFYLIRVKERDK